MRRGENQEAQNEVEKAQESKNETIRQKLEREAGSASEVTNSKPLPQCLL